MAINRHGSLRRVQTYVFFLQIHFLCSIPRRPHTDRFPDDVPKNLRQNRNRVFCEKNITEAEITGIRRIPTGITNLAHQ